MPDLSDIVACVLAGKYSEAREIARTCEERAEACKTIYVGRKRAPRISLVIVVSVGAFNKPGILDSVVQTGRDPAAEIHLIASGIEGTEKIARRYFESFAVSELGFNAGPSISRNLGAARSSGDVVLFLDDDGTCTPADIAALAEPILAGNAIATRGRIVPRQVASAIPPHYDLRQTRFTPPSTEGFSAWNREAFLSIGGFDGAMFGHEGIEISARALKFHSRKAFRYVQGASLVHDFADDPRSQRTKERRHAAMEAYMQWRGVSLEDVLRQFDPTRAMHS